MGHAFGLFRSTGYGALRAIGNLLLVLMLCAGAARAETVTIAALGDSLTQGYGLPQPDGFVPQLQRWLDAREADAALVNAGVSGDTTAGGLSRVDWTLAPEVDAMIVALGGNDFLRGIDPAVSRENLRGILEAAEAADVDVLLIGLRASNNYGPDYKAEFDAIYPELAAEFDTLLVPSFFDGLTGEDGMEAARGRYMQPDGIHPNAEGVARIVEEIGPSVLDLITRVRGGV
ncbi:arylesterase [Maritimibacter sp. 55A14]|uniref:arylesterase n=1 Tax=Maritimibacter sp. 55A14 TaxID=2174844 RepID=UPI000D61413C|nr:arylesterase [Maritimibacter sp. 55A14]PWE33549.1 arylesterase [Maritimibacter sp. 55A14]